MIAHVADLTKRLPFENASFDAVLCVHVLEHIRNDAAAIREIYRVLHPGGWAICMVPIKAGLADTIEALADISPEEMRKQFGSPDHVRWYGADYEERLRAAGFAVEVVTPVFDPVQIKRCRLLRESIHVCRKA